MQNFTAEDYIFKLLDFFDVKDFLELSQKLGVAQQTVSNWKTRNSINAIKKKCRELGIYQEIFNSADSHINNFQNSKISGAGVDNSQGSSHVYNTTPAYTINFPDYFIDELNILFKRAGNKKEDLIDALDNFISSQKKIYR